jgi:ribosomal protein L29
MKTKAKQTLKTKSVVELNKRLGEIREDIARIQLVLKDEKNKNKIKLLRRESAIIQTFIREKELVKKKA